MDPQQKGDRMTKRDAQLRVRLSAEEREQLVDDAAAAETDLSEFARARLFGRSPRRTRRADRKELARLLAALGKMGANLNQLAHHANASAAKDGAAEMPSDIQLQVIRDEVALMRCRLLAALEGEGA